MKKILIVTLMICKLFALGGMGSLVEEEKSVAKKLQSVLALDEKNAYKFYTTYFQSYLNKKEWQIHWFDNNSPSKGKMVDSPNKTMFVSLINTDRIINISIVKFAKQSQLIVYVLETLPRKSSTVMDKFDDLTKDKKFKKQRETDAFAYFSKEGYMEKINIFVNSPVGAIQYVDMAVFNIE